jgi:hypothetical protein
MDLQRRPACGIRCALLSDLGSTSEFECGSIARGIGEIDRRFESRDEPLVAVGSWIRQAGERWCVFQNSTNEKQCCFTQASVTVPGKKRFFVFPKRHMRVHA